MSAAESFPPLHMRWRSLVACPVLQAYGAQLARLHGAQQDELEVWIDSEIERGVVVTANVSDARAYRIADFASHELLARWVEGNSGADGYMRDRRSELLGSLEAVTDNKSSFACQRLLYRDPMCLPSDLTFQFVSVLVAARNRWKATTGAELFKCMRFFKNRPWDLCVDLLRELFAMGRES